MRKTRSVSTGAVKRKRPARPTLQWQAMFDALPDLIAFVDPQFNILYANRAMLAALDLTEEQLQGQKCFGCVHATDAPIAQCPLQRLMQTGEVQSAELFEPRLNGYYDIRITPLYDDAHRLLGVLHIARDISARVYAKQRQSKFELAFERSNDAIFITDINGTIEYVNPAFEKIYGFTKAEALGKTPRIIKSGLLSLQVYQNFWATLLSKQVVAGELVNKTKDGRLITVEGSANPILDEHGNIIGFLAIQHDITERKQTERALQDSEKRYRDLFDNANDLAYVHDLAGNFLAINHTAERISGFTREQALTMNIRDVLAPEYHESTRKLFAPNLRNMVPHRFDVEIITQGGNRVALELNMRLLFEDGKPVAVQGIARDISERKRAEAALRESETRFRNLFNTMLDGCAVHEIICDETGKPCDYRFIDINPAFERLTGLRRETIIGKTVREVMPNTESYWIESYGEVALTGVPRTFENYAAELGKHFHVVAYSSQPRQFAVVFADATDRHRAQELLEQRNRDQQQLLEAARVLPASLDVNQVLEQIATSAKNILNANDSSIYVLAPDKRTLMPVVVIDPLYQDELLNTPLDIEHSLTGTAVRAGRGMIFNNPVAEPIHSQIPGTPVETEERVIATPFIVDGEAMGAMCLNRLGTPFTERDLALAETFALYASAALRNAQTHRDLMHEVADRKKAEAELAQERNLLRTLIEHLPDRIFVKDTNSHYLLDNQTHRDFIGVKTVSDILRKSSFEFYPDHVAARMQAEDQTVILTGEPIVDKEEQIFHRGSDAMCWNLTTKVPLKDESGNVIGLIGVSRDITERKKAEAVLAQERQLLQTLIDNLPDYIYVKDTQCRYVLNNQTHLRSLGVSEQSQTLGKTAFDFFPYAIAAQYYIDEQMLIYTEQPLIDKEEIVVVQPGNERRWHLSSKIPLRNAAGEVIGLVGISRNVTERKRTEDALRASEEKYRKLFSEMFDGFALHEIICDDAGNAIDYVTLECNDQFEKMLNLVPGTVIGARASQFVPPDEFKKWLSIFAPVALTGKSTRYEMYSPRNEKYFEGSAYCPEKGKFAVTFADVTRRKQAEDGLRQSEERFRQLVQSQGEGVAIVDENEYFRFANPAGDQIFGVPTGKLVGRNLKEFTDPAHFQLVRQQTAHRQRGEHSTYEMEIVTAEGARRNIIVTATPQRANNGEFTGSLAVFRDITERKQMEQQLKYASTHDALTGIYNRAFFEEEVNRIEKSREYPVSIIMADVDDLKKTNDTLGHPAGDELLIRATRILQSAFRAEDIIARIGGDEFAVLLPHTDATTAADAVARIKHNLQLANAAMPDQPAASFSLGIATGEKGTLLATVMKSADRLMYQDKASKHERDKLSNTAKEHSL